MTIHKYVYRVHPLIGAINYTVDCTREVTIKNNQLFYYFLDESYWNKLALLDFPKNFQLKWLLKMISYFIIFSDKNYRNKLALLDLPKTL